MVWERDVLLRAREGVPNTMFRVGDPRAPTAGGSNAVDFRRAAADSESVRSFLCPFKETALCQKN
jgi:hypothetical protein